MSKLIETLLPICIMFFLLHPSFSAGFVVVFFLISLGIYETYAGYELSYSILWIKIFLDEPIISLCIMIFLLHPSFPAGVLVIFSWLSMSFCSGYAEYKHNNSMYRSLIDTYLKNYPDCEYTIIPLSEIFGKDFLEYNVERYSPRSLFFKGEKGYLCVVKTRFRGAKFPAAFTTFPFAHEPSYIMVRDHPSEMTTFQLYCLFHELGHLSFDQYQFHLRASNHKIQMIVVAIVVTILSYGSALAVFGATAAYFVWTTHAIETEKKDISQEIVADAFATYHLRNHLDDTTFEDLKRLVHGYLHDSLQNAKKHEDSLHARLAMFDLSLDDLAQKLTTSLDRVNNSTLWFSKFAENLWMPEFSYYLIHGSLLIICSVFTSAPTWINTVTLALPMVIGPYLIFFFEYIQKYQSNKEVEAIVNLPENIETGVRGFSDIRRQFMNFQSGYKIPKLFVDVD